MQLTYLKASPNPPAAPANMANALVLVAFLALAAASADARVLQRLEHGRILAADADADAVSICDHATFPKLCRALLPGLSHPITAESLTDAAIKMTVAKDQEAKAVTERLMADPQTTQQVKETLAVCYKSFNTALVSLAEASRLLNLPHGHEDLLHSHDQVMVQLQSALADVGNCDDAFNELPGVLNPVAHITNHLEKLTSNSLALALGAVDY